MSTGATPGTTRPHSEAARTSQRQSTAWWHGVGWNEAKRYRGRGQGGSGPSFSLWPALRVPETRGMPSTTLPFGHWHCQRTPPPCSSHVLPFTCSSGRAKALGQPFEMARREKYPCSCQVTHVLIFQRLKAVPTLERNRPPCGREVGVPHSHNARFGADRALQAALGGRDWPDGPTTRE